MKTKCAFWISLAVVIGAAPLAMAKSVVEQSAASESGYVVPLPKASTLADNVVVGGSAPAPQAAPVYVAPGQPAAAGQPVVVEPQTQRREVIHEDVSHPHNYMGTIAVSALMGGVAGALVGGAIYFLGSQNHPAYIGYWAAGGVLLGTGVGLAQIIVQEGHASQATALSDDASHHFSLALYHTQF